MRRPIGMQASAAWAAVAVLGLGVASALAADPVPAATVAAVPLQASRPTTNPMPQPTASDQLDAIDAAGGQSALLKSTTAARRPVPPKRTQSAAEETAELGPRLSCPTLGCRKSPIIFGIYY